MSGGNVLQTFLIIFDRIIYDRVEKIACHLLYSVTINQVNLTTAFQSKVGQLLNCHLAIYILHLAI